MKSMKAFRAVIGLFGLLGLAGVLAVAAVAEGGGPMPDPNPPVAAVGQAVTAAQ